MFLDCLFDARYPLSPRRVQQLLFLVSSLLALDSPSLIGCPLFFRGTRPKQVRLRYGLCHIFQGFAEVNYSVLRLVDYMCNEKFTWRVLFNSLDQPGLSWRTKDTKEHQDLSFLCADRMRK
jgi:hypothetical protein